MALTHVVTIH